MATKYACFASGGVRCTIYIICEITKSVGTYTVVLTVKYIHIGTFYYVYIYE